MAIAEMPRPLKTLAVIPARGGSKGLPGKNKRLLHGQPLVSWALAFAQALPVESIILSSDDREILDLARGLKKCIALTRPKELAADDVTDQPVLRHSLLAIEELQTTTFDRVVMLQPTAPGRSLNEVSLALELHAAMPRPERSSIWSAVKVPAHFHAGKQIFEASNSYSISRLTPLPPRRQDLNQAYVRSGDFYVIGRAALEDPYLAGDHLEIFETRGPAINIDAIEDFHLAETLLVPKGQMLIRKEMVG